jgi:hypothetical protein
MVIAFPQRENAFLFLIQGRGMCVLKRKFRRETGFLGVFLDGESIARIPEA